MTQKTSNTLIVGGSGNFGKAIAKELASSNHNLVLTYFSQKEVSDLKNLANQLKENFSVKILLAKLNVRNDSQIKNFIKNCSLPINNLVYCVSTPIAFKTINQEKWDDYETHYQVQVKGLWYLIKLLIKNNFPIKRIVALGSICLFDVPPARLASYTVAKYALWGFVKTAAIELAPQNITVNLISPGLAGKGASSIYPELILELVKKQTPLKRLVSADDIAYLVNFLVSGKADYLTGLNIPVAGGFHM